MGEKEGVGVGAWYRLSLWLVACDTHEEVLISVKVLSTSALCPLGLTES